MKRINVGLRLRHFPELKKFHTQKVAFSPTKPEFEPKSTSVHDTLLGQVLDTNPDYKTLRTVHSRIILQNRRCDSALGVKLIKSYAALKDVVSARKVFDEIPERNVIILNVMIRSYVNNGFYREGIQVFGTMCGFDVRPDHYTFPCVLKACSCSGNIVIGKKIHGSATRVGLSSTLFTGNGLVSMYGKCGFLSEARLVLDDMSRRDVVSWNSLVAGYAQNQIFDDALEVCREMESVKISHDAGTMASLLPAVTNTTRDNVMYVRDMFLKMGKKSLVSWNVMIGVYMKNAMPLEAVELYSRMMEADGIEPDSVSVTSVLPACGDTSALSLGKKIHGYVERKKLIPNLLVENALIDMYAKCGCLDRARDVFENMKSRDVVSWTAMISAYGVSGKGRDAVALFSKMQDSGLVPDSIAFVTTLAACSHAGLLEEGRSYFKLMTDHYKITPRLEHLACMVDILGRAGKVKEAYSFIQEMSMEPNERVWGALLGSCRVHSDTDIGLLAADKLFQLAPEQSGYYVLLSNIYAKAGRWEEVSKIRDIMKSKGLKKNPGASNVEVNGDIHTFLVGDRSHPQSDEIYRELDKINVAKKPEAVQKKARAVVKPQVILISPDTDVVAKAKQDQRHDVASKKKVTYSSILNARSKAAASRTLDIDSTDKDNDLGAVEYVEDMYAFYKEVELLGVSALLIASKYEEIWPPQSKQILVMEKTIMGSLEWYLTVPTQYVFLARSIKAANPDPEMENKVHFLAELGLMHTL
ncbi:unnamed protein product [Brassica rapa subsp. narinosa]